MIWLCTISCEILSSQKRKHFWYLINTRHNSTLFIHPSLKSNSLKRKLTIQNLSFSFCVSPVSCLCWVWTQTTYYMQVMGKSASLHFLTSFWEKNMILSFWFPPFTLQCNGSFCPLNYGTLKLHVQRVGWGM